MMLSRLFYISLLIVLTHALSNRIVQQQGRLITSASRRFEFTQQRRLRGWHSSKRIKDMASSALVALLDGEKGPHSAWRRLRDDTVDGGTQKEQNAMSQHKFNYVLEPRSLREKSNSHRDAWIVELNDSEMSRKVRPTDGTLVVSEQWGSVIANREFNVSANTRFIRIRFAPEGGSTAAYKILDHTQWIILDARAEFLLFSSERSIRSIKTADGTRIELNQL